MHASSERRTHEAQRPRTQVDDREIVYLVEVVSPDQEEGANADADAEADEESPRDMSGVRPRV